MIDPKKMMSLRKAERNLSLDEITREAEVSEDGGAPYWIRGGAYSKVSNTTPT